MPVKRTCAHPFAAVIIRTSHTDTLREAAISRHNARLVLSGGFDGNCVLTDLEKPEESLMHQHLTELARTSTDAVGSVRWHPAEASLCTATTDQGRCVLLDTRLALPALHIDLAKRVRYIFFHHVLLLGFRK